MSRINHDSKGVVRSNRPSVENVFLKLRQIPRKTPVQKSLFKKRL